MHEKISTNGRYTLKRWKNMYLAHISLPSAHTQIHPLVLHMYSTVDWQYALLIPIKLMHKSYHYHKRCHHHIYWRLLWLCDFIFRRKKYKFKPISRSLMSVLVWMEKVFCAYCSWSSSQSLCNNTVSCLVTFKHFTNLCSKILLFDDPKILWKKGTILEIFKCRYFEILFNEFHFSLYYRLNIHTKADNTFILSRNIRISCFLFFSFFEQYHRKQTIFGECYQHCVAVEIYLYLYNFGIDVCANLLTMPFDLYVW